MRMLTETELLTVAGGQTYEEIHENAMEFCRENPEGTYTVVTAPKEAKVEANVRGVGGGVGGSQGGITVTVNCGLGGRTQDQKKKKAKQK